MSSSPTRINHIQIQHLYTPTHHILILNPNFTLTLTIQINAYTITPRNHSSTPSHLRFNHSPISTSIYLILINNHTPSLSPIKHTTNCPHPFNSPLATQA